MATPQSRPSVILNRDQFIFRAPFRKEVRDAIVALPSQQRRWDSDHKVWRLSPRREVLVEIIQLCIRIYGCSPSVHNGKGMKFDDVLEGRTLDLTTYYTALEIEENATPEEVKKAFRVAARKYHPDINQDDPGAMTYFIAINKAYEALINPIKRKRYDVALRATRARQDSANRYNISWTP